MDVEVVKSDLFQVSVEPGSKENSSLLPKEENGVVHQVNGIGGPIKFGSHGVDEPKESALETKFPRDAVDDWPAPQQIHSFYFVKYRPYEDPELKIELEKKETDVRNRSAVRSQILDKLRAKKSDLAELVAQVKPLREERDKMKEILDEKTKEMQPLRDALSGKAWNTNGGPKEKGAALCSSEEELNTRIKDLEYRLQHETIPLKEEKQILREISHLESTRGKVASNASLRMKIQDSLGGKDAIEDQVKRVGVDIYGVKEDKRVVMSKIKPLNAEGDALKKELDDLQKALGAATTNWKSAVDARDEVWKNRDRKNTPYYKNRATLNNAKDLAARKDIEAVKKLEKSEFETFMKEWTSKKDFREDYEKRLLSSLDFRQLSRDGRIRNPDEKPLVPPTQAAPAFTANVAAAKTNVKQAKEQVDKPQKEDKVVLTKENKKKEAGSATTDLEEEEKVISGSDKLQKKQVDEAKSKEMIREEELAKAKQALERKKKLAEKAAAKAAIKAQREAEKKLKEKEKKAKKKAAASGSLPEPEERSADEEAEAAEEPEKVEEDVKPPVPSKGKPRKENTPRLRTKPRGAEALPKAILKRKRSNNYWVWAVPAAAVAAGLVVLAVGYTYFI